MSKAFVALGSNLENPVLQIKNALLALEKLPKTKLIRTSSLYQSKPVGYADQPDFINAVAEVNTQLTAEMLLNALLSIENKAGRKRSFANAPRILDCDLLLFDDAVINSAKLTLPHPRMHTRGFVLLPLAEIAPDLTLPNHGNVVKLALSHSNQDIKKLA